MSGVNFDLNAYCIGHITKNEIDRQSSNNLLALPEGFVTEAQALGASINQTSGGFAVPSFLYTDPAMLRDIPRLDIQPPIKAILEDIRKETARSIVLKVSGPYSILSSIIEPSLFYHWLIRNSLDVHAALEQLTLGLTAYIVQAIKNGARIISLADPYANPSILGSAHYKEYAGTYLIKLLHGIIEQSSCGIVHICPHSSIPLETYGYITAKSIPVEIDSTLYIDTLFKLFDNNRIVLMGHQCIYSSSISCVRSLHFVCEQR
ncbi:hypothetical protein LQZ19_10235 [Treponema primitia]|uniref:uroporphyrinogen decarboxylase family protein n=1 Tax=Treponema primitia TaxID=88058 RepID=UPI00397EAC67